MTEIPNTVFGILALVVTTETGVIAYLYKDNKRLNDLLLTTTRETLTTINNFVEVSRDRLRRKDE